MRPLRSSTPNRNQSATNVPLERSVLQRSMAVSQVPHYGHDELEQTHMGNSSCTGTSNLTSSSIELTPRKTREIQDHFKLCLRLFAENKITRKNVWDLKLIDYLKIVIKSCKDVKECLQIGSTSLEVGAKIYGLRVDDFHSDVMKMSSRLSRMFNLRNDDEMEVEVEDEPDFDNKSNRRETKIKKCRKKISIVKDPIRFTGTFPKISDNIFLFNGEADTCTSNQLLTNTRTVRLLDFETCSEKVITLSIKNKPKTGKFCERMDSVDHDDEEEFSTSEGNNSHFFDREGNPLIIELDYVPETDMILLDEEPDGIFYDGLTYPSQHVTDLRPSTVGTVAGPNCFYVPFSKKLISPILKGPNHWKFKNLYSKANCSVKTNMKKKTNKKPRKNSGPIDFFNTPLINVNKLRRCPKNTIKHEHSDYLLPNLLVDKEILDEEIYLFNKKIPATLHYVPENIVNSFRFNSNNTNRTSDRFEYNEDEILGDNVENEMDCDPNNESLEKKDGDITEDMLIKKPKMVRREIIPYAEQRTVINMKELKKAVWKCLVTNENEPEKEYSDDELKSLPASSTTFRKVCERAHRFMPPTTSNSSTTSSNFVALLHLANEHNLELVNNNETLTDFEIKSGGDSSP